MKEKWARKVPYVGVTGFRNREEVKKVLDAVAPLSGRQVMIGALANSKTISGELDNGNNRYPTSGQLGDIFEDVPGSLNIVHFSTKNPEMLFEGMIKAFNLAGPFCDGLQLNVAWPDPKALGHFKIKAPQATVILQVGARALEMVEHSPQKLADKINKEFKYFIDYGLLDLSGGTGKPFDPEEVRGYLRALEDKQMSVGLGVAGGLSPETLPDLVGPLVEEFPYLSVDVETGVRNNDDLFDTRLAISFIRKAECLFG